MGTAKEHQFAKSLSSQQQKRLRGQAHGLKPCVQMGSGGVSPSILGAIRQAADTHELIKVQLPAGTGASEKDELSTALMAALGPRFHTAGRIGRMLIVYFEKPPSEAKIPLAGVRKSTVPLN